MSTARTAEFPAPGSTVVARVAVKYCGPTNCKSSRYRVTVFNILGDRIGGTFVTYRYDVDTHDRVRDAAARGLVRLAAIGSTFQVTDQTPWFETASDWQCLVTVSRGE